VTTLWQDVHASLTVAHGELDGRLVEGEAATDVSNTGNGANWQALRLQEFESEEGVNIAINQSFDRVEVSACQVGVAEEILLLLRADDDVTLGIRHFAHVHEILGAAQFCERHTNGSWRASLSVVGSDGLTAWEAVSRGAVFADVAGSIKGADDHVIGGAVEGHRVALNFVRSWQNDGAKEMLVPFVKGRNLFLRTLGEPILGAVELAVWSVALTGKDVLCLAVIQEVEPFLFAGEIGASNGTKQTGIHLL